jgi:hypothetical protein
VFRFVLGEWHFGEICAWFAHLIASMVWLIRWNSKIDFEKAKREGTEVFSFVLRERHFVEICPPDEDNVLANQVEL